MRAKSDEQIKFQVESELNWDTRTWNLDIEVDVLEGIVSLTGVIPSYTQQVAAQDAAHRVQGVLDVANDTIVKIPNERGDEEIAHSVRKILEWDVLVPDTQIKSSITDGWVKLEGTVNTLSQKEDAARAVKNMAGVVGITNNLEIESEEAKPEDLRRKIEEALERRATREADDLSIVIEDGEVNLSGRVHSWRERLAVLGSINHTPGVKRVNDNLRIDPYY
jgi:osmotically-inducible protein OsmY